MSDEWNELFTRNVRDIYRTVPVMSEVSSPACNDEIAFLEWLWLWSR